MNDSSHATQDRMAELAAYWQNEADRYREVYEWVAANAPRIVELCPYKIAEPTNIETLPCRRCGGKGYIDASNGQRVVLAVCPECGDFS